MIKDRSALAHQVPSPRSAPGGHLQRGPTRRLRRLNELCTSGQSRTPQVINAYAITLRQPAVKDVQPTRCSSGRSLSAIFGAVAATVEGRSAEGDGRPLGHDLLDRGEDSGGESERGEDQADAARVATGCRRTFVLLVGPLGAEIAEGGTGILAHVEALLGEFSVRVFRAHFDVLRVGNVGVGRFEDARRAVVSHGWLQIGGRAAWAVQWRLGSDALAVRAPVFSGDRVAPPASRTSRRPEP